MGNGHFKLTTRYNQDESVRHLRYALIALFITVILCGCANGKALENMPSGIFEKVMENSKQMKITAVAKKVIDALEKEDKTSFKELFAKNLREAENIDKQIDAIFDKHSGEVVSFDGVERTRRERRDKKRGIWIIQQNYGYDVQLTNSSYYFFITVQTRNLQNPEEEGIQRIVFRTAKNETTDEIIIESETELLW
jgi:hypothetical protein